MFQVDEERVPVIPASPSLKIRVRPAYYLGNAHQDLATGDRARAIQSYIKYIDQLTDMNEMRMTDQVNLTKLLLHLSSSLAHPDLEEQDEIMKCYTAVINKYPENVILLNAFGVFFFTQNELIVAAYFLEKAARLQYLPAEKNYLHVIWYLIPRWHFRMLNDRKRNESYRDAIRKAVRAGFRQVYDIGTGSGLLSLIASREKKVQITALEENKVLYNLATDVFKENNVSVKLMHTNSAKLQAPPNPCNLIVTEIFDAALLGENCLRTVKHALDTFIKTDKFKIIPASATLYVTAFESEEITRSYRYVEDLPELMLTNICLVDADACPYDSEYLNKRDLKYLSQTQPFLSINFYDKTQLDMFLNQQLSCPDVDLTMSEDGVIHGLAVWFDLHLDEDIQFSTSPLITEIQCWEQAVFHLNHPVARAKGTLMKLKPQLVNGQLRFGLSGQFTPCGKCFRVSSDVISLLNDAKLVQKIIDLVDSFEDYGVKVVDFNVFPLFGFLMAKRGARVYHVYEEESDLEFYKHLMEINGLSPYRIIFIHERALLTSDVFVQAPDIVYTDFINKDGSWQGLDVGIETHVQLYCKCIPSKITLRAQLISSDYLDVCNRVDDNKVLNFKMAKHMNRYTGTEHPNLQTFPHEKLSTVATFDVSDLEVLDFHCETAITANGTCCAILYWFDLQLSDDESILFSTMESSHYDKTCSLLKTVKPVAKGDKVMVHVLRFDGHLKVYCDQ